MKHLRIGTKMAPRDTRTKTLLPYKKNVGEVYTKAHIYIYITTTA